jgi:predicted dehydrogenase
MPSRVTAMCGIGKRRDIEVEEEVTAMFEYSNGATGVFVTAVTEAPGTDRLEICGERGRLLVENEKIHFTRNEQPMTEFASTTDARFGVPPVWEIDMPVEAGRGAGHLGMIVDFIESIRDGRPPVAPAEEGIKSVELGNSMLYSALTRQPVDLPLDSATYEAFLRDLVEESTFVKKTSETSSKDMAGSFA